MPTPPVFQRFSIFPNCSPQKLCLQKLRALFPVNPTEPPVKLQPPVGFHVSRQGCASPLLLHQAFLSHHSCSTRRFFPTTPAPPHVSFLPLLLHQVCFRGDEFLELSRTSCESCARSAWWGILLLRRLRPLEACLNTSSAGIPSRCLQNSTCALSDRIVATPKGCTKPRTKALFDTFCAPNAEVSAGMAETRQVARPKPETSKDLKPKSAAILASQSTSKKQIPAQAVHNWGGPLWRPWNPLRFWRLVLWPSMDKIFARVVIRLAASHCS